VFSQSNSLILHDDAIINLHDGAILVIDQTHENGIELNGTGAGIIHSEDEGNRVAWFIKNSTGNFEIPFGLSVSQRIPLVYHIPVAGSNDGALIVSTWQTNNSNIPYPSGVLNTSALTINGTLIDKSDYCANRFWVIDDQNTWTTKPVSSLTFTYRDAELTASMNASELEAQYWENTQWNPGWYLATPIPVSVNTTNKTVTFSDTYAHGNLFPWILHDKSNPLPIELLYYSISCNEYGASIEWASASEVNNDYYTIQRSVDGGTWETIAQISGAGNSNSPLFYTYTDTDAFETDHIYKLTQTDYDGTTEVLGLKYALCAQDVAHISSDSDIKVYVDDDNNMYVTYYSQQNEVSILRLYDMYGKILGAWSLQSKQGVNNFKIPVIPVSFSIYLVSLEQHKSVISKKVILRN
jgi:hypothetical protein